MAGLRRGLQLLVESKGDEAATQLLRGLGKSAADPRPAFKQIADELAIAEGEWFASRGEGSWPDLAETTIAYKAQHGLPPDPLVATGALKRSLIVRSGSGGRRTITQKQLRYGTRVPYARFHARARTGYSRMPRRYPMISLGISERRRMVKDVRDYLMRDVNKPQSMRS